MSIASQIQPIKRSLSQIHERKCTRQHCLSHNKGHLEYIWFGKQYENKEITCSSCYMLNGQSIKKSFPVNFNILPMYNFTEKLLEEYKIYEERKKAENWHPTLLKNKKVQLMKEISFFETNLIGSLKGLQIALESFIKRITQRNAEILMNKTFNEIIESNNKNSFEQLLNKICALVKELNYCDLTKNYEFQKIEIRNKKYEKLGQKIKEVNERVTKVLSNLLEVIKKKNDSIKKI